MNTAEFDTRLRHQRRSERPEQPRLQAVTTAPITITVQTTDQELCEAIRAAAGNQYPVSIAASMDEALQLAAEGKCGILITDQALTQNALVQIGKQVRVHDPATITIAVGSRGDDNALIGLLSSAVVERFMLKPVTPSLARLVIRSAASEYQSLKYRARREAAAPKPESHDLQSGEPVVVPMPSVSATAKSEALDFRALKPAEPMQEETRVAPAPVIVEPRVPAPLTEPTPPRAGPASHVWLIAAAAALVVGVAVWWMMQSRIPDIDLRQVVATNLTAAKQALDDGRTVDPSESSALHYYSVVLSLDAANADARRGMEAVANRVTEDVKLAIVDGRLAEAGIALERLRRISPDNRRLALLDSELRKEQANQISRLQAPPPASTVQRPAAEPASTRVASKSTKSRKPPATTEPLAAEPGPILLAASSAVVAGTMTANPLDMGPPAPPSIPGASAAGKSASVDAAIASLPAPVVAHPEPVIPDDPKLVKMVQPDFPRDARERSVEGWVDVTLAVTAAGDVASARVSSSENGRFFERAALTAVKKWRYEPRPLADPAATQPVRVRVSFKLQD